jgi:hypothetical protein
MRLLLVTAEFDENTPVSIIHLPPTSLANWSTYVKIMDRAIGKGGFMRTKTLMRMNPSTDYSNVVFAAVGPHDKPELAIALRKMHQDALLMSASPN